MPDNRVPLAFADHGILNGLAEIEECGRAVSGHKEQSTGTKRKSVEAALLM